MVEYADENGDEYIAARAVAEFLGNKFPNPNGDIRVRKANLSKARYWGLYRALFLNSMHPLGNEQFAHCTSRCCGQARMRFQRKARCGRGQKLPEWRVSFCEALLDEFERLRSANF